MELVQIEKRQRDAHVIAETVALIGVVPLLGYVATRERQLTRSERRLVGFVALGTLVVDGWLLWRYLKS